MLPRSILCYALQKAGKYYRSLFPAVRGRVMQNVTTVYKRVVSLFVLVTYRWQPTTIINPVKIRAWISRRAEALLILHIYLLIFYD